MSKIEKDKGEFDDLLNMIWDDLYIVYKIAGEKFVSSIKDLSEKHPRPYRTNVGINLAENRLDRIYSLC